MGVWTVLNRLIIKGVVAGFCKTGLDQLNKIRLLSLSGDTMSHTMKKLAHKITNLPTVLRVRALNTVANLLELKVMLQSSNQPLICLLRCCFCSLS